MARLLLRLVLAVAALGALLILGFVVNAAIGMRVHARDAGSVTGLRLRGPVTILRDDRGVPHVLAGNDHDLFFAQGYAEGADRLFQMDLLRRFVLGELAEVFGPAALQHDRLEREVPVRAIASAQWQRLGLPSREILGAFSEGVNAAMEREPLPVEFRLMAYRPRPWTPQDSLAVSMATVLDLTDDWNDIEPRDAAYRQGGARLLRALFPLTDPCYDAPVTAGLGAIGPGAACNRNVAALVSELSDARAPVGSNAWAAGSNRALRGRALLANDPHLALHMPGVWYLIDLRAPHFHVAGATLPGCPGVVLGHNENLAWGATNGTVTSLSAFLQPANLDPSGWQSEQFGVRFRPNSRARYYRTHDTFGATTTNHRSVLVRWEAYENPVSPASNVPRAGPRGVDRSRDDRAREFPGPTQNFVLADTAGARPTSSPEAFRTTRSARWFHPASDLAKRYPRDTIRAAAEGRAITRRGGMDGEQQDVWPEVSVRTEPPVRDAVSRLSHRAAASGASRRTTWSISRKCSSTCCRFRSASSHATFRRRSAIATHRWPPSLRRGTARWTAPLRRRPSSKACASR